ncbi:MAG TPA: ribose ABC transporter permease [Fusobacteriaceae bacterium]|nr:ribose ABC transporter permease [Fusobacteriaceae bacterium]
MDKSQNISLENEKNKIKFSFKIKNSNLAKNLSSLVALVGLITFFTMMNSNFIAFGNLMTITQQTSIFAILAIAETFIIITSGIDLSVGSVLAVSGVVAGKMLVSGYSIPMAIIGGLLSGTLCGVISGLIISKLDIAPFIATLGMMSIARGAAYVITGAMPVSGLPENFYFLGGGTIFGLPVPTIIMITLAMIFSFVLKKTSFGRCVYTLGSNEDAAKLSGVNVNKVKIGVYAISGLLAALVGIMMAARLVSAQSNAGIGYELDAIAAAIIGGTSPLGGVGTIGGTIIGALIMGVIRNGLNIIGINAFWQQIAIGSIIILAVLVDKMRRK